MKSDKLFIQLMSICAMLAMYFMYRKLSNGIDWEWIWVLFPLWLPVLCYIAGVFLGVLLIHLKDILK